MTTFSAVEFVPLPSQKVKTDLCCQSLSARTPCRNRQLTMISSTQTTMVLALLHSPFGWLQSMRNTRSEISQQAAEGFHGPVLAKKKNLYDSTLHFFLFFFFFIRLKDKADFHAFFHFYSAKNIQNIRSLLYLKTMFQVHWL